jgi:hypothetical protein
MTELAGSLDKVVTDSANIRVKHSDVQSKEAMAGIVAATLAAVSSRKVPVSAREIALPDSIDVEIIVPGNMDINPTQLNISDFVNDGDDESDEHKHSLYNAANEE